MREYRFRGKTTIGHKWVEGSLIHVDGTFENDRWPNVPMNSYTCILQDESKLHPIDWPYLDCSTGCIDGYLTPVDPDTVGQFAGLCDRNGTKIFEGDIVKGKDNLEHVLDVLGYIDHENGSFVIVGDIMRHYRWLDYDVEVIGNKWDSPELLEVE